MKLFAVSSDKDIASVSAIGNAETLLYSLAKNSVWIPVVLLFVPFFVLCSNVGYLFLSKGSNQQSLKKELTRRKQLSVQYENMNIKGTRVCHMYTVFLDSHDQTNLPTPFSFLLDYQVGEDLSLAFRSFYCIPNGIAKSKKASTIKKVDLTETMVIILYTLFFLSSSRLISFLVIDNSDY